MVRTEGVVNYLVAEVAAGNLHKWAGSVGMATAQPMGQSKHMTWGGRGSGCGTYL